MQVDDKFHIEDSLVLVFGEGQRHNENRYGHKIIGGTALYVMGDDGVKRLIVTKHLLYLRYPRVCVALTSLTNIRTFRTLVIGASS